MRTIEEICAEHRAFYAAGATKDISFRAAALRRLEQAIRTHEGEVLAALKDDLNKSAFEGYETEVGLVYGELKDAIAHTARWAKPKRVSTPIIHFPSSSVILKEPYGTVLVMAPWNYPFQLTMNPLIGAVAAGNCCVLKPSEYAPRTAEVIEKLVAEAFDPGHVSVVRGGRAANASLLDQRFDSIFFTGSPAVGRVVMQAAAKNLTPVTLELGGKSPCIVDETADTALAARRIIWGKCLNAGQTCIAPDYLFVHRTKKDALMEEMKKAIRAFYGETPECCEEYPKIINDKHFARLKRLMADGHILTGGRINEKTRQIAPTLIDGVTFESPIMQEEIFGPLFPVFTFERMEEVYAFVESRPKPLACYLFSNDKKTIDETMNRLSFGGGCVNDTITHIANAHLPFGGVGQSGMGQYHGKRSFDVFTHEKAVLKKGGWLDIPVRYPPYKNKLNLLKKIL